MEGFMRIRAPRLSPVLGLLALGVLTACNSDGTTLAPASSSGPAFALAGDTTGNGAPSGAHYNLNIIGAPKTKNPDMSTAGGNVIFVNLGTKDDAAVTTKILLNQSASAGEFAVLDKNGT